nr:Mu transposase C-terminal domain-containing protein [Phytoactinopolyspora limicola]
MGDRWSCSEAASSRGRGVDLEDRNLVACCGKLGWIAAGHESNTDEELDSVGDLLTEAFLWSAQRRVTKTATVSLHNNVYEVDATLVGHKVELVFDPFDLTRIEARYDGRSYGPAVRHTVGRHAHPKARPETPATPTPEPTGINYAELTAEIHHRQIAEAERINYTDLVNAGPAAQLPGQLSIHDALHDQGSEGSEGSMR